MYPDSFSLSLYFSYSIDIYLPYCSSIIRLWEGVAFFLCLEEGSAARAYSCCSWFVTRVLTSSLKCGLTSGFVTTFVLDLFLGI